MPIFSLSSTPISYICITAPIVAPRLIGKIGNHLGANSKSVHIFAARDLLLWQDSGDAPVIAASKGEANLDQRVDQWLVEAAILIYCSVGLDAQRMKAVLRLKVAPMGCCGSMLQTSPNTTQNPKTCDIFTFMWSRGQVVTCSPNCITHLCFAGSNCICRTWCATLSSLRNFLSERRDARHQARCLRTGLPGHS